MHCLLLVSIVRQLMIIIDEEKARNSGKQRPEKKKF